MGSTEVNLELALHAAEVAGAAKGASRVLATATGEQKKRFLKRAAALIRERCNALLAANQIDVAAAPEFGLNAAAFDRLTLTPARLNAAAAALEQVAALTDPVGETIEGSVRPNGLAV